MPVATGRPDDMDEMSSEAIAYCQQVDTGTPVTQATAVHPAHRGSFQTAGFCSLTALKIAKSKILGKTAATQLYGEELAKFGDCDPKYAEAAEKYAEYFVAQQKEIPYVVYKNLSDFVVDGKLPAQAKVAIVGDWGTGQDAAKLVLRQIANKKPDVVIHLGDIYYAGTQFEVDNYFLQPWKQILNLPASPGILKAHRILQCLAAADTYLHFCGIIFSAFGRERFGREPAAFSGLKFVLGMGFACAISPFIFLTIAMRAEPDERSLSGRGSLGFRFRLHCASYGDAGAIAPAVGGRVLDSLSPACGVGGRYLRLFRRAIVGSAPDGASNQPEENLGGCRGITGRT